MSLTDQPTTLRRSARRVPAQLERLLQWVGTIAETLRRANGLPRRVLQVPPAAAGAKRADPPGKKRCEALQRARHQTPKRTTVDVSHGSLPRPHPRKSVADSMCTGTAYP